MIHVQLISWCSRTTCSPGKIRLKTSVSSWHDVKRHRDSCMILSPWPGSMLIMSAGADQQLTSTIGHIKLFITHTIGGHACVRVDTIITMPALKLLRPVLMPIYIISSRVHVQPALHPAWLRDLAHQSEALADETIQLVYLSLRKQQQIVLFVQSGGCWRHTCILSLGCLSKSTRDPFTQTQQTSTQLVGVYLIGRDGDHVVTICACDAWTQFNP